MGDYCMDQTRIHKEVAIKWVTVFVCCFNVHSNCTKVSREIQS